MDTETVLKAMNGDKDAFSIVVEETRKGLLGLALSKVKNIQVAEDVVQEAYVKAYRKLSELRRPDRVLPWLRAIIVNEAAGYLRTLNGCRCMAMVDENVAIAVERTKEARVDLPRPVAEAVRRLPRAGREAVVLVKLMGLSPAEAAEILGISRTAIDVRLNRAMNALRRELSISMDKVTEGMLDESRAYCVRIAGCIAQRLANDEPKEIRSVARELRIMATRSNIPQIIKDLSNPVTGRIKEAARIARETGDLRLLPGLCKALEFCEDPTTLIDLIKALEVMKDPAGLEPLRNIIRRTAHADVISAARDAVDALRSLNGVTLKDIPVSAADLVAAGLDRILMDLAVNPDREVAMDALEGLGRLGCAKAAPLAIEAFKRGDPLVRLAAVHCLGVLGNRSQGIVACLREGLHDQVESVVMASAEALADLCDYDSAPTIAERLASYKANGPVPWAMGENLARLLNGPCETEIRDKAIGTIIRYLTHPHPIIRNCSCYTLRKCAITGYTAYNDEILRASGLLGAVIDSQLAHGLDRMSLYIAVARSGDNRSIPGLEQCMDNTDKWGRAVIGEVLAELGSPGLESLEVLACDTSKTIDCRISAVDALEDAASADDEAMGCLIRLIEGVRGEKRLETRASLALKRARRGTRR